ncbi:MAG TPA: hypothetical protein GX506_10345 [Firmicutes bacterium]|nr:hypothetical protein [Bacillota bacterium]
MAQQPRPLRGNQGPATFKKAETNGTAKILVGVTVLALVIASGVYFGLMQFHPRDIGHEENPNMPGPIQEFDSIVVNVAGTGGERYLKTSIALELTTSQANRELTARKAEARDIIISKLSAMPFAKLQTEKGREELKQEIIRGINDLLRQGKVEKVYFTEFVMQ